MEEKIVIDAKLKSILQGCDQKDTILTKDSNCHQCEELIF